MTHVSISERKLRQDLAESLRRLQAVAGRFGFLSENGSRPELLRIRNDLKEAEDLVREAENRLATYFLENSHE